MWSRLNRYLGIFIRLVKGALVGAGTGGLFGLVVASRHQPQPTPGQPLQHEWYIFAVIAAVVYLGGAGAILGASIRLLPDAPARWRAIVVALLGLVVGLASAPRSFRMPPNAAEYIVFRSIWFGIAGAFLGFALSLLYPRLRRRTRRSTPAP